MQVLALGPGCLQRGVAWPLGSRARRAAAARGASLLRAPRTRLSQKNREPPAAALFGAPPPTSQRSGIVKEDGAPPECTAGAAAVVSVQQASLPPSCPALRPVCPPAGLPWGRVPSVPSCPLLSSLGPISKLLGNFLSQGGITGVFLARGDPGRVINACAGN